MGSWWHCCSAGHAADGAQLDSDGWVFLICDNCDKKYKVDK